MPHKRFSQSEETFSIPEISVCFEKNGVFQQPQAFTLIDPCRPSMCNRDVSPHGVHILAFVRFIAPFKKWRI
jgi:hypothetical protein